ncbi:hypothetical protein, partial [Stenomitos frigidus]|uniref:hypothetical protein n=1 Tax=Stenomitos frigidus TaxID=1886765 RepID=UPI001C63B58E
GKIHACFSSHSDEASESIASKPASKAFCHKTAGSSPDVTPRKETDRRGSADRIVSLKRDRAIDSYENTPTKA